MPKPPKQSFNLGGEPGEPTIDWIVGDFFHMMPWSGLNPRAPESIPSIVIGGFVANKRGFALLTEFLDAEAGGDFEKRMSAEALGQHRAEENMMRIGEIVSNAVLSVTERKPESDAIRYLGVYPVAAAVGDLDPYSHPGRPKTTLGGETGGRSDLMRLTGKDRDDFYLINVIGEDFEPLVDIRIIEQPKRGLRTTIHQFIGWLKG